MAVTFCDLGFGEKYVTLRFFFAALRLCVKTAVRKTNLTQRREGAKTRKAKDTEAIAPV